MKTVNHYTSSRFKIAIPLLTFAFFWLVIGDLINYHQKAIYGFDIFKSQPFSKPEKKDTGTLLLKTKNGKSVSHDESTPFNQLFLADLCSTQLGDFAKVVTVGFFDQYLQQQIAAQAISLRGPPAVI